MKRSLTWINWPIIIVSTGLLLTLIVAANLNSPLRSLVAFGFLLVCPGMAFVRLLHLTDRWVELGLAVPLSIALDTLIAEMLVLLKIWSLNGAVIVLVAISIGGAALQGVISYRARLAARSAQ